MMQAGGFNQGFMPTEILQNYTQEYVWTPRETHLLHSLVYTYMYINIYIADLLLCTSTHSM